MQQMEQIGGLAEEYGTGRWVWYPAEGRMQFSDGWYDIAKLAKSESDGVITRLESIHADDRKNVNLALAACFNNTAQAFEVMYRMAPAGGNELWVLEKGTVRQRDENGAVVCLSAVVMDVTRTQHSQQNEEQLTLQQARLTLQQQAGLLQSVNFVATRLVTADTEGFTQALWESLRAIGQAVGAERAYIWQNYEQDGRPFCRQIYEWSEGAKPQQQEDFAQSLPYDEVPFWRDRVHAGIALNGPVKGLPASERVILEPQGIVSILVLPITIENTVWGFIGFDDCHLERVFSQAEEQVLQSAGVIIIGALVRNNMTGTLLDARSELQGQEKLLRAVNEVAGIVIREDNNDFEDLVLQALEVLAHSVDADRGFLWRNSVIDGVLCGTELCEWAQEEHSFGEADSAPVDVPLDSFLPEWRTTLLEGKNLNMLVRDMGEEFRNSPAGQGVLTTMNIPLVVHGEFWGLIGFDDLHRERLYTETEMDILRSGGMLIATAMLRNELLDSLVEAKDEALASTRAKSEFLSRMSHEIRTPLNAVIGMATLADKSDDITRIKYCIDKIGASSRQLLSIINDVLDMSKIESGKFEVYPQAFDFEKMLQHTINVVQVKLEERYQELVLEMPRAFGREMVSDELRLSQVLINLLTNAIKFTPEHGVITLRISAREHGKDAATLHVEVQDTGIGISKEQQAKLFASFQQADGGITRQYGGTGLGLAISKAITQMLDGDIWLESELGAGSTFAFEVQVGWGAEHPMAAAELPDSLRVLVVDDSPDVLDYFENILSGFGIVCDVAPGGREAIALVQAAQDNGRKYDLVFVDWMMPDMDGAATAAEILKIAPRDTGLIIISVADHADIQGRMEQAGVRSFLAKPVLPSVLYDTIVQSTGHARQQTRQEHTVQRDWHGKTVLAAEDIEINREILTALLEDTGVAIECVENGALAVERFRASGGSYDLVLMDVQMPVMDGLEATRRIRALADVPNAATVPIVAMTANAFKEDVKSCLDAGMNNHVAKPLELENMLATMALYLDA